MNPRIILASGSQSRRAVLAAAGVEAETIKSNVDEDAAKAAFRAEPMSVRDQAMKLAEMKSMKVSMRENGLVIGCDQMLSLDNQAFDKPVDLEGARDHLRKLSGKTHTLETGIVISENGEPVWRYLARPKLTMRVLSEDFIEDYVETVGAPLLSTVGAYQLEGLGTQLFSRIEGDYFSILGLPLLPLLDYLRVRKVLPS
ncbi:MAG: septum formation protein Maf [Alphaproteobacteria bacterium]|jgi:septum formation protein|nr:septum formation protein Maf [Hyphomonas sp.]MBR9809007.1 septum formation protein Maf [Alphaproteobacteria bacterium]|tara:strand:- start:4242 stop:4838 length:597 start_codon:yes stop_codon:yes gene_type:complete